MSETIFSKIIRRELPADIVYEDDEVLGFRDLNPQAPVHVLFIPKRPIASLDTADAGDAELLGKLMLATAAYAREQGIADEGYRVVVNCNERGGQTVYHIHLHLLGGRDMTWPPG